MLFTDLKGFTALSEKFTPRKLVHDLHECSSAFEQLPRHPEAQCLVNTVQYAFGEVPLALAYSAGFVMLWTDPRWQQRLQVLAPMGRMALTDYLDQTIIAIALFHGIGLGRKVSMLGYESIALTVFIVQVLWSHWLLKRFHFGPVEWKWCSLTYGS